MLSLADLPWKFDCIDGNADGNVDVNADNAIGLLLMLFSVMRLSKVVELVAVCNVMFVNLLVLLFVGAVANLLLAFLQTIFALELIVGSVKCGVVSLEKFPSICSSLIG